MPLFKRNQMQTQPEDVVENENDGQDEGEPEEEKPQFATIDQMQALIEAQGQQMQNTLTTLLEPKQVPAAEPEPEFLPEVNDEDIAQAMEDGEFKKAAKLQRQQRERDRQIHNYELNKLQQQGATWVSNVTQKMAQEKLPNYGKYKDEIDAVLVTFPVHLRANEEIIQFVYNSVRGKHIDEEFEQRQKDEEEAKRRQANLDANPGKPTGNRRQAASGRSYEEDEPYFSREVDDTLRVAGRSNDEQARVMGYASWAEYEKMAKQYDGEYEMNHGHRWLGKGNK